MLFKDVAIIVKDSSFKKYKYFGVMVNKLIKSKKSTMFLQKLDCVGVVK